MESLPTSIKSDSEAEDVEAGSNETSVAVDTPLTVESSQAEDRTSQPTETHLFWRIPVQEIPDLTKSYLLEGNAQPTVETINAMEMDSNSSQNTDGSILREASKPEDNTLHSNDNTIPLETSKQSVADIDLKPENTNLESNDVSNLVSEEIPQPTEEQTELKFLQVDDDFVQDDTSLEPFDINADPKVFDEHLSSDACQTTDSEKTFQQIQKQANRKLMDVDAESESLGEPSSSYAHQTVHTIETLEQTAECSIILKSLKTGYDTKPVESSLPTDKVILLEPPRNDNNAKQIDVQFSSEVSETVNMPVSEDPKPLECESPSNDCNADHKLVETTEQTVEDPLLVETLQLAVESLEILTTTKLTNTPSETLSTAIPTQVSQAAKAQSHASSAELLEIVASTLLDIQKKNESKQEQNSQLTIQSSSVVHSEPMDTRPVIDSWKAAVALRLGQRLQPVDETSPSPVDSIPVEASQSVATSNLSHPFSEPADTMIPETQQPLATEKSESETDSSDVLEPSCYYDTSKSNLWLPMDFPFDVPYQAAKLNFDINELSRSDIVLRVLLMYFRYPLHTTRVLCSWMFCYWVFYCYFGYVKLFLTMAPETYEKMRKGLGRFFNLPKTVINRNNVDTNDPTLKESIIERVIKDPGWKRYSMQEHLYKHMPYISVFVAVLLDYFNYLDVYYSIFLFLFFAFNKLMDIFF